MSGIQSDPPPNSNHNHNSKAQEWWLPSFPRWSWTAAFAAGPRNDLIGLLADRALVGLRKHLDPDGPVVQKLLDQHLPRDSIREQLPGLYGSALSSLRYQRDAYLVGTKHAYEQQQQREEKGQGQGQLPKKTHQNGNDYNYDDNDNDDDDKRLPRMPRDATALGYAQLVRLGESLLPSETVRASLLPIVLGLPSGALRTTIVTTVSNALPLAQPPLDAAVKHAVMGVMNDPQIRKLIKSRTQQILRVEDDDRERNHEHNR
mmetsp:Transcript_17267/g.47546  ORF Transcript_17267/g.47546 Transcript_17267/m.47546 type:complete len:260 (-) Transcript_17267:104-883(-)